MKGTLKDPLLTTTRTTRTTITKQQNNNNNNNKQKSSIFLNRQSSDESVKEGYFWANIDSTWTILDQKRLVSMDYLYHRSLEFHNNHHTFRATGDYDYTKELGDMYPSEIAYEVYNFQKNRFSSLPRVVTCGEIVKYLSRLKLPEEGLIWFNIKDLRALAPLGELLQLHAVTLSHFYDLRGHSAVNAVENGIFASFCNVTLFGDDAELHKIYTFTAKKFILTYERELIAEPEDPNLPVTNSAKSVDITKDLRNYAPFSRATQALQSLRAAAASEPPISEGSNEHTMSSESLPSSKISTNTPADTTQTPGTMPSSPTKVVPMEVSTIFGHGESLCVLNQLKNRMNPELFERIATLGTIYVLYEIGTETLATSDSLIEFISRTIFHLKQQIHRSMTYRQKLHFHRKIDILLANVRMVATFVEEIHRNLTQILNKTSVEFDIVLNRNAFSWEQIVYISCLIDSYEFKLTCLNRQLHDVESMETAMSNVTAVRSEKTSINFTLIATVFLPLTFFAGVFGMNFQEDGGYTMEVLNRKYGPEFFWALCVVVILLNIYFFLSTGLITTRENDGILSDDGRASRWLSTSTVSTEDVMSGEEGDTVGPLESFNGDLSIGKSMSYSDRASAVDKRSIQEEFKRITESKARRKRDAGQYR